MLPALVILILAALPLFGDRVHPLTIAAAMLCLIGLITAVRRQSRRMETNADAVGHGNEASEGTYARALERLHEVNAVPAVLRARRVTHPHLYDRMLASGVTPSYPRPEPPPRLPTLLGAWIAPLLVAAALLLPMRVVLKSDPTYANDTTLLIRVAILGRRSDLRTLARRAQDRGDESAASALRRAADTRDAGGECEEVQGRMD